MKCIAPRLERDKLYAMYGIDWDDDTGGFVLVDKKEPGLRNEVRPVFHEGNCSARPGKIQ